MLIISTDRKPLSYRQYATMVRLYPGLAREGEFMTRTEHLNWCKARALQYVDIGDLTNAYASMTSDLSKHDETRNHPAASLGMTLLMNGQLSTASEMRKFIKGFN